MAAALGWTLTDGINSRTEFVQLARQFGEPIPNRAGELIKRITPCTTHGAPRDTLSHRFGLGRFPFHTDTAFWPLPARYLVLRVLHDFARVSHVVSFNEILTGFASELVEQSVWVAKTPISSMYCSMRFCHQGESGFRYDRNCMIPVNSAAHSVREGLGELLQHPCAVEIKWCAGRVLVLDNWRVLHARGPHPSDELDRVLERIYVR